MEYSDTNCWRVTCPQRLSVRRWGEEVVVYDQRSGDTLIFENLAGQVLEHLLCANAGVDELLSVVDERHADEAVEPRQVAQIYDVIERLCHKGLVTPFRK